MAYPYDYEPRGEQARLSAESRPVIVYLHGTGERGSDIRRVKTHGPWRSHPLNAGVSQYLDRYVVIGPQLPSGAWAVDRLIETLRVAFSEVVRSGMQIDWTRVHVTGNSLGGRGALTLALEGFPAPDGGLERRLPFRTAVIICPDEGAPDRLHGDTQYHFFNRAQDWNPHTRRKYQNFRSAPNARFHDFRGYNHDCWSAVYGRAALYGWLEDPNGSYDWGAACDRGYCTQAAGSEVVARDSDTALFCAQHAGDGDWLAGYRQRVAASKQGAPEVP